MQEGGYRLTARFSLRCNRRGLPLQIEYFAFLKQALTGKQPGLGNLILTRESPSQEVLDVFRTPTDGYQDYTVVVIDTTDFENGGELTIDVEVGRDEGEGDFYLFDGEIVHFFDEKTPKNVLDRTCCGPGRTGRITRRFYNGQLFRLGATGQPDRAVPCVNAFRATVSVKDNSDADTSVASKTEFRVALDSTQPAQEILDIFRAPGSGYQDYTVVNVDTTAFEDGGTLSI